MAFTTKTTTSRKDVSEAISAKIIEALQGADIAPWSRPWKVKEDFPRNFVSQREYRGVNAFMLHVLGSFVHNYRSQQWLTFKQATDLGNKLKKPIHVRKGEKHFPIVFWKMIKKKQEDPDDSPQFYPAGRYYMVWNVDQIEGLELPPVEGLIKTFNPIEKAEEILSRIPGNPKIQHGGGKAFFRPSEDVIGMPEKLMFKSEQDYYMSLFHELIHWTGHSSRLDRKGVSERAPFGTPLYSEEELCAEIGSCILASHAGFGEEVMQQACSYVKGWLKPLQGDTHFVVNAAQRAQKAVDYILGTTFQEEVADE